MANHDRITRKIELANKKMTLKMVDGVVVDADKGIQAMKDSTQLFTEGKFAELLAVLREDGYILVRQVLPQAHVQNARVSMLKHLATKGAVDKGNWASHDGAIADDFLKQPGWTVDAESGGFVDGRESDSAIEGWQKLGLEVKKLFDGERLKEFYNHLFGYRTFEKHMQSTMHRIRMARSVFAHVSGCLFFSIFIYPVYLFLLLSF